MEKIFLAFPSWEVQLKEKISKIDNFEFWNLNKIKEDEFVNLIQGKIKPLNKNVIRNYYHYGDYKKAYANSDWGMLLPDYDGEFDGSGWASHLLIKLFSGCPLTVMFTVGKGGIRIKKDNISNLEKAHWHKEDLKFKDRKFIKFYGALSSVLINTHWDARKVLKWSKEEWKLYIAICQFEELFKYFRIKDSMRWQSECADIVSLYEILLSSEKNDGGQYRIIQRIEILLGGFYEKEISDIKEGLKKLYASRNEFVHGSYFDRLKKETKFYPDDNEMAQMPKVDFDFLERQFEIAREVLIVYLVLLKSVKKFKGCENRSISKIINDGIMDIKTRSLIQSCSKEILELLI